MPSLIFFQTFSRTLAILYNWAVLNAITIPVPVGPWIVLIRRKNKESVDDAAR